MIYSIIFDWKQTLYDPESGELITGAQDVLRYLKQRNATLYLVGKGADDMHAAVVRLKVKPYFKDILFVGTEKHPDHYRPFINPSAPSKTLIIGDKLNSEIEVGNIMGAITIQVRQGKFANDVPKNNNQRPDMIVSSLPELLPILDSYVL